jgi:surface protein
MRKGGDQGTECDWKQMKEYESKMKSNEGRKRMKQRGNSIVKHMLVVLAAVLLVGVFMAVRPESAFAADSIASGGTEKLLWRIDSNGKLVVVGTGDVDRYALASDDGILNAGVSVPEWYSYREKITSAVINVTGMKNAKCLFAGCTNMKSVNLSGFDTSKVTDMSGMFLCCTGLTTLDVSGFDTSKVTDMREMFGACTGLTSLDVSSFNTAKVTNMNFMFALCDGLTTLDLSSFNTAKVVDMSYMFAYCEGLTALDVSSFNTAKVTDMNSMFLYCSGLTTLDVSSFNTAKVTDMSYMFGACSGLTTLDLSNFDMRSVTNAELMLAVCTGATTIYAPYNVGISIGFPTSLDTWYRSDGKLATELPQNLTSSVALGKSYTPAEKIKVTTKNATISLSKTSYTYDGKAKTPTVTITNSTGKTLKEGSDYRVTYKNNTEAGKATVSIRFMDKYSGTITKTFTIVPKATTLSKVTSSKTKTLAVTWAKQATQTTGYEIQYTTDSKFKKNLATVTVESAKTTDKTIENLSANTKYYVRIRTYKTVDGKKYYSAWSKAKSAKTK